mmetsp:Transcript_34480/g.103125  ORF Transcript_34480/g.103125 Transcript_34480/m.103125 type:complete len:547 (-) Transcript_34480:525-2165(-)
MNADDDEQMMDGDSSSESMDDVATEILHAEHKANGNECYKKKDYRGAIAHYTLAIETAKAEIDDGVDAATETKPLLATYYGNRASAFNMILKYKEALEDCDAALATEPSFTKAYFRKAKIQTIVGDLDGAIKSYSLGMIRDPNDSKIIKDKEEIATLKQRLELARDLLAKIRDGSTLPSSIKRDAMQALRQIEIVIAKCSAWNDASLVKIEALVYLERFNEGYSLSTKLMRMGMSGSSNLIFFRARCLFGQGNLDDAIKHLRQILAGDPDNRLAMTLLKELRSLGRKKEEADTAYKGRNFDAGVGFYTEALDMCPSTDGSAYRAKLFFNRASANANLRKHEDVVADCTEAISLDDEYFKAYMRRAASNLVIGGENECQQALRDYEKALELAKTEEQERDINKKIRGARVQLKRAKRKDFYKLLGVSRDATESEIKKGYRKLALKWHPDRHSNSTEEEKKKAEQVFRDVNLAYEVLSDPQKKRRYDEGVDEQDLDNPHARPDDGMGGMQGHSGMGGMDPDVLFQMFMQQQGGMGGGGRRGPGSFHFG